MKDIFIFVGFIRLIMAIAALSMQCGGNNPSAILWLVIALYATEKVIEGIPARGNNLD